MTRVWERLFLGGIADAEMLARANPQRITSVLTLCPHPPRVRAADVEYFHLPIEDDRPILGKRLGEILDVMYQNIRRGRLLTHCLAGSSRSPIIVAAWMRIVGYKHIEECLSEIARLRPIVDPSPVLLASVKEQIR
jgi:protein-tyrosine phosphatase